MPGAGFSCLIFGVAGLLSGGLFPGIQGKPMQVKPGCRYEGRRYQEGAIVTTSEPCLQCRCVEASLRCRLRVCPRIPDPPPPECHLRVSSKHVCCEEMICGDEYEGENSLRRVDLEIEDVVEENGCLFEGVRYGAGSAMMATRRCEYCYCILGARRCVRPKCLLPLPGCAPLYAPHSCCPVAYNCTRQKEGETSTTKASLSSTGCRVGNRVYNEGEMVKDIAWKAPCDNCFCAMGSVRCVPLSCAPPLQGCVPILRGGQCCPSTYNCSGSIEVKATQNYASYAFVSKDYANFRKETHFYPVDNQVNPIISNAIVEGRGHRIIDGASHTTDYHDLIDVTTFRSVAVADSTSSSTKSETETMGNEIFSDTTVTEPIRSTEYDMSTTFTTPLSTEMTTNSEVPTSTRESTTLESTTYESSTPEEGAWTTIEPDPLEERLDGLVPEDDPGMTERATALSDSTMTTNEPTLVTRDEIEGREKLISTTREPATSLPTTILVPDDILVMNVTLKTNVSVGQVEGITVTTVRSIPPDMETILNITQREKGEDYDYYSEPTLPPSLPNVRIIPFLAADALVKNDKDATFGVTAYSLGPNGLMLDLQRPTDNPNFYDIVTRENRFSPPVETEGGFVPRDPPYFETSYHSTDLSLEIGTGVTVVPGDITNPNRKEDGIIRTSCRFETRKYRHGDFIPNSGPCVICMCYYGEVVCSDEKCPPLKIGCRRVNREHGCCGEIICIDTAESPTMVLDRADATAPSQRQGVTSSDGIVTPDPFRDVIKTEPAPDLPSLIEDMIPYLVERGISTPRPTTPMSNGVKSSQNLDFGKIPMLHSTIYNNYRDQIDRRKDEDVVVTGAPIPATDGNGYDFHTGNFEGLNFQKFSRPEEDTEGTEYEKDPGFLEFPYDKRTPDGVPGSDTNLGNFSNADKFGYGHNDSTGSVNPSVPGAEANLEPVSHSPTTTEIVAFETAVEKTETEEDGQEEPDDKEESIYSFGNVLDLLFSEPTTGKPVPRNNASVATDFPTSTKPTTTSSPDTTTYQATRPYESTTIKPPLQIEEAPTVGGSLLKLAGCNIYGRMYRVGRIITELSGPCLECRCTEIGVQCKKLSC